MTLPRRSGREEFIKLGEDYSLIGKTEFLTGFSSWVRIPLVFLFNNNMSNKNKFPTWITFPILLIIAVTGIITVCGSFSYMIDHSNEKWVLFAVIGVYFVFLLFMKFLYKNTLPSLLNIDRRRNKKQLENIKNQLMEKLSADQLSSISNVLADPNFDITHYASNVRGFMELVSDAQEKELEMKSRYITATTGMLLGGGYSKSKK